MAAQDNTQSQQIGEVWEKTVGDQVARLESFYAEVGKLESSGIAQVTAGLDEAARLAKESVAFAQQLAQQWRKLALETTRRAADLFAPSKA